MSGKQTKKKQKKKRNQNNQNNREYSFVLYLFTGLFVMLIGYVSMFQITKSREVINNSTYQTSDVTVKVGTKSDNAEATKLVEEAIATQDQEKINAAISKASALK